MIAIQRVLDHQSVGAHWIDYQESGCQVKCCLFPALLSTTSGLEDAFFHSFFNAFNFAFLLDESSVHQVGLLFLVSSVFSGHTL